MKIAWYYFDYFDIFIEWTLNWGVPTFNIFDSQYWWYPLLWYPILVIYTTLISNIGDIHYFDTQYWWYPLIWYPMSYRSFNFLLFNPQTRLDLFAYPTCIKYSLQTYIEYQQRFTSFTRYHIQTINYSHRCRLGMTAGTVSFKTFANQEKTVDIGVSVRNEDVRFSLVFYRNLVLIR